MKVLAVDFDFDYLEEVIRFAKECIHYFVPVVVSLLYGMRHVVPVSAVIIVGRSLTFYA
jgi:hypothetical protein